LILAEGVVVAAVVVVVVNSDRVMMTNDYDYYSSALLYKQDGWLYTRKRETRRRMLTC